MKFLVLVLIVLNLIQAGDQSAHTPENWLREAETAYAGGDFRQSAKLYQRAIDAGIDRSEVYFNLGNAYFQSRDLGRALVNYRRAEQIAPRDNDLKLNMARIRAQRIDALGEYVSLSDQVTNSLNEIASNFELELLLLTIWWISCGFGIAYALLPNWRKLTKSIVIVGSVLLLIFGVLESIRLVGDIAHPSAVVVSETASVMSGPDESYMELFELHTAAEVRIIEQRNGWVRIQLPDLEEGWVELEAVEKV